MRRFRTYDASPEPDTTDTIVARSSSLDGTVHAALRQPHPRTSVVAVSGEIDMDSVQPLDEILARVLPGTPGATVHVDLTDVTFSDAAGMGTLVHWRSRFAAAGMTMAVRNPRPLVYRLLLLCGLVDALDVRLATD